MRDKKLHFNFNVEGSKIRIKVFNKEKTSEKLFMCQKFIIIQSEEALEFLGAIKFNENNNI